MMAKLRSAGAEAWSELARLHAATSGQRPRSFPRSLYRVKIDAARTLRGLERAYGRENVAPPEALGELLAELRASLIADRRERARAKPRRPS